MWPLLAALLAVDPDLDALTAQLENRTCVFALERFSACEIRPWRDRLFDWLNLDYPEHRCPMGAAHCLAKLGPRAKAAVPALLTALERTIDFDTGDGIIGVRSAVAGALGEIGDARAIPALARALERKPDDALLDALARFGPTAGEHWKLAAASPTPAAIRFLRKAGRQEAVPALIAALANPQTAAEAAIALGTLGAGTSALEDCVRAKALEAPARSECARALKAPGSVPVLREALRHADTAHGAADALARLGPAARPALPELMSVVRWPSLVERKGKTMVYNQESMRRVQTRAAALKAVYAIDPALIAPFVSDPEIGGAARKLIRTPPR